VYQVDEEFRWSAFDIRPEFRRPGCRAVCPISWLVLLVLFLHWRANQESSKEPLDGVERALILVHK